MLYKKKKSALFAPFLKAQENREQLNQELSGPCNCQELNSGEEYKS